MGAAGKAELVEAGANPELSLRRHRGFLRPALVMLGLYFVVGAGHLHYSAVARPANGRACFANQKTIAGAVEMYNLDFDAEVQELNPEFLQVLASHGYLQEVPRDPGSPGASQALYRYSRESGNGIECLRHGQIVYEPGRERPRQAAAESLASYLTRLGRSADQVAIAQRLEEESGSKLTPGARPGAGWFDLRRDGRCCECRKGEPSPPCTCLLRDLLVGFLLLGAAAWAPRPRRALGENPSTTPPPRQGVR